MNANWKADYKGYGMVLGRHFHNDEAHFVVTRPNREGRPEEVHHGYCHGQHMSDEAAWEAAERAAHAYIDENLPPLD
jgi:hypothetical protein